MNAILERAKAHYEALPRREVLVPEWGADGNPLKVTWSKLTVREEERIYEPVDGRPAPSGIVRLRTVILKACGEDGKRLFDEMAEHALRYEVDAEIVGRIANAILFGAGLIEKNGQDKGAAGVIAAAKNA
ncbi:hypothetical protein [Rhizobium sp. Leaf386]|uniref:hypothetical protein n=1 Tax=Rhizobium sp. Leaf386 TaxID=1736359 RepID=UPI000713D990|nr:hypothetical protein [Rhizobium sp. Leaf386]KQS90300.1 hypothetical protein ASG50_07535 [Rhizobium sp. Leaf386]